MKRKTIIIIMLAIIFIFPAKAVEISARSGVVIEMKTGEIVYSKNHNEILPMASTTKIMTALTVIEEYPELDKVVKVPAFAAKTEGSSMYLKENEEISVKDLLYGLMLVSGNDAANALALSTAGTIENFVNKMNEKSKELGLISTSFSNPSGLPAKEHFTTAYELAIIAARALKNNTFSEIVRTKRTSTQSGRVLVNHNKLLSMYDGCIGVKTGFTKEAGRCLVSAAEKDGIILVAVTLKASDDWSDHMAMLNEGFSKVIKNTAFNTGEKEFEVSLGGGAKDKIRVSNDSGAYFISVDGKSNYSEKVLLPSYVLAPVKKGQRIGEIRIIQNGNIVSVSNLVAKEGAAEHPPLKPQEKYKASVKNLFEKIF